MHPKNKRVFVYSNLKTGWRVLCFFWIVAQIAFYLNLYRVLSEGVLLGSGRLYELTFGRYTLINYLYFINGFIVAAYPIFSLLLQEKKKVLRFMFFLSLLSLPFHGVKSTLIFPVLIAFFCDAIIFKRFNRKIIVSITFVIIFSFFMSAVVREGDADSFTYIFEKILLYLSPSYSNLELQLSLAPLYSEGRLSFGFFNAFFDFVSNGFQRASDRFDTSQIRGTDYSVALVNPAYNTATIFRSGYLDFGYPGLVLISTLISIYLFMIQCICSRNFNLATVFIASVCTVQTLFLFWDNHFFRYQYFWWYFIAFVFHFSFKYRLVWGKKCSTI